MGSIAERMELLLAMYRDRLVPLKAKQLEDPRCDRDGSGSNLYAGALRFTGVAEFFVEKDAGRFRQRLETSASLQVQLFRRYDAGESIAASLVVMLSYKGLFDALAAGAWQISHE